MYKDVAIQNRLNIIKLKEKLAGICQETYYLFITGFNTGLKLQELLNLKKEDLMKIKKTKADEIVEPFFGKKLKLTWKSSQIKNIFSPTKHCSSI